MSATRFGRMAANDPRLVYDIRAGREVRATMANKIRALIESRGSGGESGETGGGKAGRALS